MSINLKVVVVLNINNIYIILFVLCTNKVSICCITCYTTNEQQTFDNIYFILVFLENEIHLNTVVNISSELKRKDKNTKKLKQPEHFEKKKLIKSENCNHQANLEKFSLL